MQLRNGKVVVKPPPPAPALLPPPPPPTNAEGPAQDADTTSRTGFFDLPIEVRIHIYSYWFLLPCPFPASDLDKMLKEEISNDVDQRNPVAVDFHANASEIILRHNVLRIASDSDELSAMIDEQPARMIRKIRHLRMSHTSLITAVENHSGEFETDSPLSDDGGMNAYEKTSEEQVDHLCFFPQQVAFDRLDSKWLPNLQTLTIDIGRIDEEPQPVSGFTPVRESNIRWPSWLDESEAVRNRRYRSILQRIQSRIPARICKDLTVIVNAKMDPKPATPHWYSAGRMGIDYRPVLHTRLSYRVDDHVSVKVHERWKGWLTWRRVRPGLWRIAGIPGRVENRKIGWHGANAGFPEPTNIPGWTYTDAGVSHVLVRA